MQQATNRARSTAGSTGVHDVHRHGPVDRGKGTIDQSNRPTDMSQLSVGPGQPGRSIEDNGRSIGRSTDRGVLFSFWGSDSFFVLGSNPIRVPKSLGLSGYKYGLEPSCIEF